MGGKPINMEFGKQKFQLTTHRKGRRAWLGPLFYSITSKVWFCKIHLVENGVLPNGATIKIFSIICIPISVGGPVKLSKVRAYSACRRVGRRSKLMSSNRWDLEDFKGEYLNFNTLSHSLTFKLPKLLPALNYSIFLCFYYILVVIVCWELNSLPHRFSYRILCNQGWFLNPERILNDFTNMQLFLF